MRRALVALTSVTILASCTPAAPDRASPTPSPTLEASATYEVFPSTVRFGDTPTATLRNTGNVPLEYGLVYNIELYRDGEWINISEHPDDSEPFCAFPGLSLLVKPGGTETQRVKGCNQYGEVLAYAPGRYRAIKTVRTVVMGEGRPEEITLSAEFEVDAATGPVPSPTACHVLCMSDTRVKPGQTVRVDWDPPERYGWGYLSLLSPGPDRTLTWVVNLAGRPEDEEIRTMWDGIGYEDIGYSGSASWRWQVPKRLEPGIYSIAKEGHDRRNKPGGQSTKWWVVAFEVSP